MENKRVVSPFENICAVVIILLQINLEGYQDPNVKDTYKTLNKYVFFLFFFCFFFFRKTHIKH